MKRKKPGPVITVDDLSAAIEEARILLDGNFPNREDGYSLKDGWFTAAEYCSLVKAKHQIVKFPANISRDLQRLAEDGKAESKRVRGWDIAKSRRIVLIVYRVKKEAPNAKSVDRSKRSVSI